MEEIMSKEYEQWQTLCRLLTNRGIEVNNDSELMNAIITWES